jgi:hypothetical protein
VQDELMELRAHEHTSLRQTRKWSALPPGSPLFHSILAFQNFPGASPVDEQPKRHGLTLKLATVSGQTNHPINLTVILDGDNVDILVEWAGTLLASSQVDTVIRHLGSLLGGLTGSADQVLSAVPMLSEVERKRLITDMARGGRP